ncbi:MAG: hypothetical protein KAI27_04570 [Rhodospirillaceae bacterium]|nr:hypothetical protein [Rhodospirillaceae bacterium]
MLSGIGNSTPVPNVVSMLVKAVEERADDIKEDIAEAKEAKKERLAAAEAKKQSRESSQDSEYAHAQDNSKDVHSSGMQGSGTQVDIEV